MVGYNNSKTHTCKDNAIVGSNIVAQLQFQGDKSFSGGFPGQSQGLASNGAVASRWDIERIICLRGNNGGKGADCEVDD